MSEFDSFFGAVWRGEAPVEALVDWILERVDDYDWLPTDPESHPYAYYSYDAPEGIDVNVFMHINRDFDPSYIWVTLQEVFTRHKQSKVFTRETIGITMGDWLERNIDFMRSIIDKRKQEHEQERA